MYTQILHKLSIGLFVGMSFLLLSCVEENKITLENDLLNIEISPVGAELQSIFNKKSGREILWIGDSSFWKARSPIMFPVNVRMKDDKFSYRSSEYQMPMMGIVKDADFILQPRSDKNRAFFTLSSSETSRQYYPFDFQLEVQYELLENELINRFAVKNKGNDTLYFALGGHPGFYCPLESGKTRADYEYVFPEKLTLDRIEVSGNFLQDRQIPFLQNESRLSLDDERIPNGGMFLKNSNIKSIGIAEKGKPPFVTMNLGDFPNINLWTPPGYPFACIEAMVSHHDIQASPLEIEKKSHLIALAPGEERTYAYSIVVNQHL